MSGKNYESFVSQLKRHEGRVTFKNGRHKPYRCPAGHLTIGYGRNLDANGISEEDAEFLLEKDIEQACRDVESYLGSPYWERLDDVRFYALANMAFNMGLARLRKFDGTRELIIAALDNGDWDAVAAGILNSKYARRDVPKRAKEIAEQMRTGEWQ